MPPKISPNRRRSIAVLGRPSSSKATQQRRRAYSIVPGEKLSPAARARRLVPRKSILKSRASQDSTLTSASADELASNNATMTMDFTEIRASNITKTLGRRVSFASHAHVRLFGSTSRGEGDDDGGDEDEEDEEDDRRTREREEAASRRGTRRRSSTAFTELGERSMDMDEDDTAPIPQQFLHGPAIGDEELNEDEYGADMDMTEALPGSFDPSRASSSRDSLGLPRRSSIAPVVTSSQFHNENQTPRRAPLSESQPPQQRLYPSLDNAPDPSPSRLPTSEREDEHDAADTTLASDMDLTTTSSAEHTTSTTGDDTTQPMEFTIPVVRPPPPPSDMWLKLRAITHSGEEPYVPPEPEEQDDPEANAIVPSPGHEQTQPRANEGQAGDDDADGNNSSMELTDALTRLVKARTSLGLPIRTDGGGAPGDTTFSSTDDSFGGEMSFEDIDNRTVNLTSMRLSLAANSTMDMTGIYGGTMHGETSMDEQSISPAQLVEEPTVPTQLTEESVIPTQLVEEPVIPTQLVEEPVIPTQILEEPVVPTQLNEPEGNPAGQAGSTRTSTAPPPQLQLQLNPLNNQQMFTFGKSAPPPAASRSQEGTEPTTPLPLNIFSFTAKPQASPSKVAPAPPPPKSPAKAQVVPIPFKFTMPPKPTLRNSPTKQAQLSNARVPSPTKLPPVFKGTAAFAPRNVSKSPLKRPAPPADGDSDRPSPTKKRAVEAKQASAAPPATAPANRRISGVRRPSGYFAQRKSLGGPGAPLPLGGLAKSISAPTGFDSVALNETTLTRGSEQPTQGGELDEDAEREVQEPELPTIQVQRASSPEQRTTPPGGAEFLSLSSSAATRGPGRASPVPLNTRDVSARMPDRAEEHAPAPAPRKSVAFSTPAEENPDEEEGGLDMDDPYELDEDDEPSISVEQFFEMTNIRFLDEITAPRRSMVHPGHLAQRNRRRESQGETVPLSEFVVATAVDVPQLELYHELSAQLAAWVEESRRICLQAEEDAVKVTPTLFREFADADESEKQDLLHQLKLIKANNIDSAKSQWYDWKSSWVVQLQQSAEDAFRDLESDAKTLERIVEQAQAMVPSLREEYAQIIAELEKEEADIAEIESSDKGYLSDLKMSIAEQDVEVQALEANVSEAQAKLDRLLEKEAEIASQKDGLLAAIAHGEEVIQRQTKSTSLEVFRLKDELEALEDLHLWRAAKLDPDLKQFVYASRFLVSIPCVSHKPVVSRIRVERTKASRQKERDDFPELTELMLLSAQHVATVSGKEDDLRVIIQRLSDFWTSCAQIRLQLTFLSIQYPLDLILIPVPDGLPTLEVTAKVLFPSVKSKAAVTYILDSDTYSRWPLSIGLLKCDVKIAYGRADRQQILDAVQSRLSQATSSENHGCLLDACIEATEQLAFA